MDEAVEIERNKRVSRAYLDRVLGSGDLAALAELIDPNVVLHGSSGREHLGSDALEGFVSTMSQAFDGTEVSIECEIVNGLNARRCPWGRANALVADSGQNGARQRNRRNTMAEITNVMTLLEAGPALRLAR